MKIALVYDRVNKWGGAERVLLALHKLFPNAPLYTSVYNKEKAQWAKTFNIKTSFLQKLPFASTNHELLALLMPIAFESFNFDGYDLVISVTSEAAKGIITKPQTRHICYCLTPTRYLWSGYDQYFRNKVLKLVSIPAISYLRTWEKSASSRPDIFVALSKEVQQRIKKYYNRDSELIYPPVWLYDSNKKISNLADSNYYLLVSRLSKFTNYKRVDLAIKAFNKLRLPLKIIGSGSWEEELKKMSQPNIEFLGNISDEDLSVYYKNCKALIFPAQEDFGLTLVEAQMFGKPVIAYGGGGALETVVNHKTGILFNEQTSESLIKAVKEFDQFKFEKKDLLNQARKFSQEIFQKNFLSLVDKVI